ncbi:MAG: hypothetical protein JSU92_12785 [Deltaproteobacteria bacterium]|nr:MAG: hypothetical protein JSU92_12785 [Deltaproteobacteria bacterium]
MVDSLIDRYDLEYFLEGDYDNPSFRINDSVIKKIAFALYDKQEVGEDENTDHPVPARNEELSYYERELRRQVQKRVTTILKESWA